MSLERRDREYLSDVLEAMRRIIAYTCDLSREQFLEDRRTQDAVIRNIEVIGEAAKSLSAALKAKHPAIPWKEMASMRDKVIHHYFGINYDIVWNVAKKEIPNTVHQVESVLTEVDDGNVPPD